ncbi:MAG: hypothetical protein ACOCY6_04845 [Halodesulfurarchaeum sp.]
MARCPHCQETIEHVSAEILELDPTDAVEAESEEPSRAVATVCPECDSIIGI